MKKSMNKENMSKLERIYEQYKKLMFKEAFYILHDIDDTEDALQQAFLKIMDYVDTIDENKPGMTCNFLKMVVKNTAKDIYRKRMYLNNKEDTIEKMDVSKSTYKLGVSDFVVDKDTVERISNEIIKLPEKYRDVILLEKVYGYSREQTMTMLGQSYETLKKRLTRGKAKLLEVLRKEGLADGREDTGENVRRSN